MSKEIQPLIRQLSHLPWRLLLAILSLLIVYELLDVVLIEAASAPVRILIRLLVYGIITGALIVWTMSSLQRLVTSERLENSILEGIANRDSVVESLPDAVIGLDQHEVIRSWNRGAEELFGYSTAEMVGQPLSRLLPVVAQSLPEASSGQDRTPVACYEIPRGGNGATVTVEMSRTVVRDAKGRVLATAAILRDITPLRRMEAQIQELRRTLQAYMSVSSHHVDCARCHVVDEVEKLRQDYTRLQELDRYKSDLISVAAHDLRAPLTNIAGSIELMRANCDHTTTTCGSMFKVINQQTEHLIRLVQGVLNVSRLEEGRLHLHRQPVVVADLIEQAVDSLQGRTTQHTFDIYIDEHLPIVWADPDRIQEVLVNLLDNAVKYSPDGGMIQIEARPSDGNLIISIRDPGIGISTDELPYVFHKYHRTDHGQERNIEGHGLGLYICEKLVQAHGGRIWVESAPGQGSRFSFSLPAGIPLNTK